MTPATQARFKLLGSTLNTYGFAIVGAAAIQPLTREHVVFPMAYIFVGVFGVALHCLAIYIAPRGEK